MQFLTASNNVIPKFKF